MSRSLGKKNFSKQGLAAVCIYEMLFARELQKNASEGIRGVDSLIPIAEEAKRQAMTSELLLLSRAELEEKATQVKGKNSSWGSYSAFASDVFNEE
jgi:hypothetical protein